MFESLRKVQILSATDVKINFGSEIPKDEQKDSENSILDKAYEYILRKRGLIRPFFLANFLESHISPPYEFSVRRSGNLGNEITIFVKAPYIRPL